MGNPPGQPHSLKQYFTDRAPLPVLLQNLFEICVFCYLAKLWFFSQFFVKLKYVINCEIIEQINFREAIFRPFLNVNFQALCISNFSYLRKLK